MAPQITNLAIVYSTVYSGADQSLSEGNSPVTGGFPASNAEHVSIWWRHHAFKMEGEVSWKTDSRSMLQSPDGIECRPDRNSAVVAMGISNHNMQICLEFVSNKLHHVQDTTETRLQVNCILVQNNTLQIQHCRRFADNILKWIFITLFQSKVHSSKFVPGTGWHWFR